MHVLAGRGEKRGNRGWVRDLKVGPARAEIHSYTYKEPPFQVRGLFIF
jgi:hypothetical protein